MAPSLVVFWRGQLLTALPSRRIHRWVVSSIPTKLPCFVDTSGAASLWEFWRKRLRASLTESAPAVFLRPQSPGSAAFLQRCCLRVGRGRSAAYDRRTLSVRSTHPCLAASGSLIPPRGCHRTQAVVATYAYRAPRGVPLHCWGVSVRAHKSNIHSHSWCASGRYIRAHRTAMSTARPGWRVHRWVGLLGYDMYALKL